jgi:hypothetical protein
MMHFAKRLRVEKIIYHNFDSTNTQNMKKLIFNLSLLFFSSAAFAQAWMKGGNGLSPNPPTVGTDVTYNSQLQVITQGFDRMWIHHRGAGALQNYPGALANPLPGNRLTRIGISRDGSAPLNTPLCMLHLGYNWPIPGVAGGFRSWQDVGTMYSQQTDNFYVGMRQKSATDPTGRTSTVLLNPTDANDAVISWGDNDPLNPPAPDDNLTFLFHAPLGAGPPSPFNPPFATSDYGREVMRLTGIGNVGIGPVFFDNAQPQNLLHVNNNNSVQTYVQVSTAAGTGQTGTDGFHFGITAGGAPAGAIAEVRNYENSDMRFYTNNTQRMVIKNNLPGNIGRVGINTNAPGNRLEISTMLGDFGFGSINGSSGLRFTNLVSTATPLANPGQGVLSVNASGDVIYVDAFGTVCPASGVQIAAAQLTANRQLPLNNFNFIFSETNAGTGKVGIGKAIGCAPGNQLEVKTNVPGPLSGLRLTDLAGSPAALPNPHTPNKVLSVNLAGDVILTTASAGLGNPCPTGPLNPLLGDWQIPLANNDFVFSGQGTSKNNVGIGIAGCNPTAKLEVLESSTNPNSIAVLSRNTDLDGVAVKGVALGSASNAQTKVGGWFAASPAVGAQQVAIYVPAGGGLVNIGYPTPSSVGSGGGLLNVNGTGAFNGDVIPVVDCNPSERCGNPSNRWFEVWSCNGSIQTSDERLKENVRPLTYGIDAIKKLRPVTYSWKGNPAYGDKIGFIAQELKTVIKEVVREGDDQNKTLGVNYAELIPVLIKGMQEQQNQIENQDQKISDQQKQIDELKAMVQANASSGSNSKTKAVSLSDKNAIVLDQNVPNPFAESTSISYNIPVDFTKAQLIFNTSDGKIIRVVDITEKGKGHLNVFAQDLSSGMYSYSLIVDGKIIETKKMLKN